MFKRVLFLQDFFRTPVNGLSMASDANRSFLEAFFQNAFARNGIQTLPYQPDKTIDVAAVMQRLGLACEVDGWAATVDADLSNALGGTILEDLDTSDLVIGWGLTPAVQRFFDNQRISYLDIEVSSLRFSEFKQFSVRTNNKKLRENLKFIEIPNNYYWNEASKWRAHFAIRHKNRNIFSKDVEVALFVMQSNIDLSLIQDGERKSCKAVIDNIKNIANKFDIFAIKAHPYEKNNPDILYLQKEIENSVLIDENIYYLMSAENVRFICALSSGCTNEAAYFGKRGHSILVPDRTNPAKLPDGAAEWINVASTIADPDFWSAVVCGVPEIKKPLAQPDRTIDWLLGIAWGYEENPAQVKPLPDIGACGELEFGGGGTGAGALMAGWSDEEAWGRWSDGNHATLGIQYTVRDLSPVEMTLVGHPATYHDRRASVEITAFCTHGRIDIDVMPDGEKVFLTVFPDSTGDACIFVKFAVLKPLELPADGLDKRKLGFGVKRLQLGRIV